MQYRIIFNSVTVSNGKAPMCDNLSRRFVSECYAAMKGAKPPSYVYTDVKVKDPDRLIHSRSSKVKIKR